jgi:hypothetical protein
MEGSTNTKKKQASKRRHKRERMYIGIWILHFREKETGKSCKGANKGGGGEQRAKRNIIIPPERRPIYMNSRSTSCLICNVFRAFQARRE